MGEGGLLSTRWREREEYNGEVHTEKEGKGGGEYFSEKTR
jgi:hypothetical protein